MTQRGERRPPLRPVDGIVLLDKPLGLSSNDALQRVKRLFRAEKAGHTGSLDPLATGLLPICLGEATKLCGLLLEGDKHYRARVHVGASTTTGDAEGDIEHRSDCSSLDRSALLDAIEPLLLEAQPVFTEVARVGEPHRAWRAGLQDAIN